MISGGGRSASARRAVSACLASVWILVTACGGPTVSSTSPSPSSAGSPSATAPLPAAGSVPSSGPDASLVTAAVGEGHLTTIGLPHDWCNYGEALKTFAERYPIQITELNSDAAFADQLAAIRTNCTGPDAPDVIDVGRRFAAQAKAEKLISPYKVAAWDQIPAVFKDPEASWYGDYFSVLAFETNATVIADPPRDWKDLLEPSRTGTVALAGDPRVNDQAIQTVYAAALGNGGSLDKPRAGLDFFAKLATSGNLVPQIASQSTIDDATTPVTVRWTTNALAHRAVAGDQPKIDVTVPLTGRLGDFSTQAISAFAPHPNAARLWMEFLYSDAGQTLWLQANCLPARLEAMKAANVIPADLLPDLPDVARVVVPTLAQLDAASAFITANWDSVVKVDVK